MNQQHDFLKRLAERARTEYGPVTAGTMFAFVTYDAEERREYQERGLGFIDLEMFVLEHIAPNGRVKPDVKLVGEDGNAFAVLGRVSRAMKAAGWTNHEIDAYRAEAMASDYDHLLATTIQYVNDSGEEQPAEEDEE